MGEPRAEAATAQLQLTEVVKSQRPVVRGALGELAPKPPEAALVEPYGDYTIVLPKDGRRVQIFDKQAKEIDEFAQLGSTTVVDWPSLRRTRRLNPTLHLPPRRAEERVEGYLYTDQLSDPRLANFATSLMSSSRVRLMEIPDQPLRVNTENLNDISIIPRDNYILIYDRRTNAWVGYKTRNQQGQPLPPRNWVRQDNIGDPSLGGLSEDTVHDLANSGVTKLVRTEGDNAVLAGQTGISLVEFGKSINEAVSIDAIRGVGKNLCVDPENPAVVYYAKTDEPTGITRIDMSGTQDTWRPEQITLPKRYVGITNLELDPTGRFFLAETPNGLAILSKDTLQEVKMIPAVGGRFDSAGRIRAVDKQGHLVVLEANLDRIRAELESQRMTRLAQGITVEQLFQEAPADVEEITPQQHVEPIKQRFTQVFQERVGKVQTLEDLRTTSAALESLRTQLRGQKLKEEEIAYVTSDIQRAIHTKQVELAAPLAKAVMEKLDARLTPSGLSIASLPDARADIAQLSVLEGFLDTATRTNIRALEARLNTHATELFRTHGTLIERYVGEVIAGVRAKLDGLTTMSEFSDWQEFDLPQLRARLGEIAKDAPLEAVDAQAALLAAQGNLQKISQEYSERMRTQYAEIRARASDLTETKVSLAAREIESLVERLRERGFTSREQAEQYLSGSDAKKLLEAEIVALERENTDAAKALQRQLQVALSNALFGIEMGGLTQVSETGQQMVRLGDTLFPIWEALVKEKVEKQVDLIFLPNERTTGPGVAPDQIWGDVGLMIINTRGQLEKVRLYEGWENENEWRLGPGSHRGEPIPPSYVTQGEYRKIRSAYADWSKGERSSIRKQLLEKRNAVHEWYKERKRIGERKEEDVAWQQKHQGLLNEYATFAKGHYIAILSRIDQVKLAPNGQFENGKGFIPEWKGHWALDEDTEGYLGKIAKLFKMQLDLQAGILMFEGHAGTGKDVALSIFSNRTRRPYFATDCSKWITEAELSEDVILEAKDGASFTMKMPSEVLSGITTPGAVVYFNEFNAMTEQAQIFLHALMDEKRSITLKTSSGKTVRAQPTVLLAGSMNPNYPGTFKPQYATKSRMVHLEFGYPPLYREPYLNDPNPNRPYNASEALRLAREVDSLAPYTYEANLDRNDFVLMWNKYVNGIDNGASDLNIVQRFDMDTILALIQFGNRLRENFILQYSGDAQARRRALPVSQPLTGREMRWCVYDLNQIPEAEKATGDPEQVARDLLGRFFLTHIDDREDRQKIRDAMESWTSTKRPAP